MEALLDWACNHSKHGCSPTHYDLEVAAMEKIGIKTKLLEIEQGTKFFNFMEEFVASGKKTGTAKLKDGTVHGFRYVTSKEIDGKKIHYIQL